MLLAKRKERNIGEAWKGGCDSYVKGLKRIAGKQEVDDGEQHKEEGEGAGSMLLEEIIDRGIEVTEKARRIKNVCV